MSTVEQIQFGQETHNRQKPNLLRIYADNQDKRVMLIFWSSLIVIAIITAVIAIFLPPTFITLDNGSQTQGTNLQNCKYPVIYNQSQYLTCGSFNSSNPETGLLMLDMDVTNQFAYLYVHYEIKNTSNQAVSNFLINQPGNLVLFTLESEISPENIKIFMKPNIIDKQQNITFEADSNSEIWQINNRFIGFKSYQGYIRKITHQNYLVKISFSNSSQLDNVSNIYITATTINPQFTLFSIIIRLVFFSISGMSACMYWYYYFVKTPSQEKIVQQHIICLLSFIQILFNDPLYSLTILVPNPVNNTISVLFVINFLVYLLFLWIAFLRRIHYENGLKSTTVAIKWWIMMYLSLLFVLLIGYYMLIAFYHIGEAPVIPSTYSKSYAMLVLRICAYIWLGLGFVYILGLYAVNFYYWNQKIWRNKFFLIFSLFFFIILVLGFLLGQWGIYDQTAARTMIWYMSLNLFTFYIQKMYTTTQQEIENLSQYFDKSYLFRKIGFKIKSSAYKKSILKQDEKSQNHDQLELTQQNINTQQKKDKIAQFEDEDNFQQEFHID